MRRYGESMAMFERASKVTCGGAQTSSKAPGKVGPVGAYPLYLREARGACVTDVDGNRYVDWFGGNCAVTLGHGYQPVVDGVSAALGRYGALPSLPTELEVEVAEKICEVVPCAESARFLKTGSEATAAAVRIARMATGRKVIVVPKGHYAGWHDWTIARTDFHPGVPAEMEGLIRTYDWGTAGLLDALNFRDMDAAALIIEPAIPHAPDAVKLRQIVDWAHEAGALVIFDEMICGGRLALGGAQEATGVTPDLATFGKSYANGFPFAFVCGSRALMESAWPISGTFGGEVAGLAACRSVLRVYRGYFGEADPIERMAAVGKLLTDGFNGVAARLGMAVRLRGEPCRPWMDWGVDEPATALPLRRSLFQQELAERGVLTHWGAWNPSAAHEAQHVEATLVAVEGALTATGECLNSPDPASFLRGELIRPAFTRPA